MKHIRLSLVPAIAALALAGCGPATKSMPAPAGAPPGREPAAARAAPPETPADRAAFAEPQGTLSLRDALRAALAHSPELSAYSWEFRAREAEALQAAARPNPELGLEVENVAGRGERKGLEGAESTIALSQLIELGGKRGKRLAVAGLNRDVAAWDYEIARIEVLTGTTKAFLEVLAAQEQLALAEELVAVAGNLHAAVDRRVEAGGASPVEASRAGVELATSRLHRERARRTLAAARVRLAASWGGTAPRFSEAVGDLEDLPGLPPPEALRSRIDPSPDLARREAEVDLRRADLEFERSRGVPDLTVGAGVRHFRGSGDAAFVFELGLPLPLFDRNRGGSRAAAARVRRAAEERRAAGVRLETAFARAREELLAADSEVRTLRDHALPEAESAFRSARDAYLRGSVRLADVLDTERLLYELESRHVGALLRYRTALADVERLAGASGAVSPGDPGRTRP